MAPEALTPITVNQSKGSPNVSNLRILLVNPCLFVSASYHVYKVDLWSDSLLMAGNYGVTDCQTQKDYLNFVLLQVACSNLFLFLISEIEGSSSGWTLLWHFRFSCLTANFFVLNIYILPYSAKNKIIKASALMGVIK